MEAHCRLCKKYNGTPGTVLYINVGPKLWWAWDRDHLLLTTKIILEKTATPEGRARHFTLIARVCRRANRAAERIRKTDLSKLSDETLLERYAWLMAETEHANAFLNFDIDVIDTYPAQELKEMVHRELQLSEEEFSTVYNGLTASPHKSYVQEEEEMILRAAKEIAARPRLRTRLTAGDLSAARVQARRIAKRFWWTGLGWESLAIKDEADFATAIRERLTTDIDGALSHIERYADEVRQNKSALFERYRLSEEARERILFFEEYTPRHDERKEMQCRVIWAFHLLLREVAQRIGESVEETEWLWYDEVPGILKAGRLDHGMITTRKRAVAMLVENGQMQRWEGDEAIRIRDENFPQADSSIREIRGEAASLGVARGIARVCAGAAEALANVKEGEVLITGMTMPEYAPAMRRAAAIVTDEGGITCHAAIVARELKKPCVIATRIATQVFKDGEMVEVDATNGVVRKIDR